MLHKDIKVGLSRINGVGLFAKKDLPKGTVIWELDSKTVIYSEREFSQMSSTQRKFLKKYGWRQFGLWLCGIDSSRFMNHSCYPNAVNMDDITVVLIRGVKAGEEITIDYTTYTESITICNCGSTDCMSKMEAIPKRM